MFELQKISSVCLDLSRVTGEANDEEAAGRDDGACVLDAFEIKDDAGSRDDRKASDGADIT